MCEIAKEDRPLAGCARYLAALHELCQQVMLAQQRP